MVIVAGLMVAMIGMLGLAIDGGRIYIERRLLQNAADATALGAADAYTGWIRSHPGPPPDAAGAQTAAFDAGAQEFGDMVQGSTVSLDGSPPASLEDCTSGGAALQKYVSTNGSFHMWLEMINPQFAKDKSARVFRACVSDSLSMAFIQVLNGVATNNVQAEAEAVSAQSIPTPGVVLFILDPSNVKGPAPCGTSTPKNSLEDGGGGSLEVNGSVVSDGNINISNNTAVSIYDSGQVEDHCDTALVTNGNVCWYTTPMPVPTPACPASTGTSQFTQAGPFADPLGPRRVNWAASSNYFTGVDTGVYLQRSPTDTNFSNTVELQPGQYTDNPFPTGTKNLCWFDEPGVYEWQHGLSGPSDQGLVSNELTPPAGVDASGSLPNQENPPFSWNGGGLSTSGVGSSECVGSLHAYYTPCSASCTTYYLRVASARDDKTLGGLTTACSTGCWRESYLSNSTSGSGCLPVTVDAATTIQVGISNVPGMGNTPGTGTSPGVPAGTDANETLLGSRYDIYASTSCSATASSWVYVAKADFSKGTGTQSLSGLTSCPSLPGSAPATTNKFLTDSGCTLGYVVSDSINLTTELGVLFPAPGSSCSLSSPTVPLAGLGACSPSYVGNTTGNDVANERYCLPASGVGYCDVTQAPSFRSDTPGGVLYYFPTTVPTGSGACLSSTNGGLQHYIYGSAELYDVVFYAPDNCSAHVTGNQGGQFTGWGYMPGLNDNLQLDGSGQPFNGGLDVWDLIIQGSGNLIVPGGIPTFVTTQPLGARLIICTNTTPFCSGTP